MGELRLHVHGMDCAEETALVRRALAADRGVTSIEFDLIHSFVHVSFDETRTDAARIAKAIDATGLTTHAAPDRSSADAALHTHAHHHPRGDYSTLWTAASGALLVAGWTVEAAIGGWRATFEQEPQAPGAIAFYALSALAGLWPMWPRAVAALRHLRLDMHVLVCVSVIGAAVIGEWSEGATVAFLFALAHRIEAWSIERARTEIAALVGRGPEIVTAGLQQTAPVERWIERFASVYTPVVASAALVVAVVPPLVDGRWSVWFYRALVFLVLGCPCALVISTPVTIVAALTSAARRGILIKGGGALERAAIAASTPRALADAGVQVVAARDASPSAIDSADVVLATADESAASFLIAHARRALHVIRQNVAIALVTKLVFLVFASLGTAPLWMAVLADTGATVIVTLNGLRLLQAKSPG